MEEIFFSSVIRWLLLCLPMFSLLAFRRLSILKCSLNFRRSELGWSRISPLVVSKWLLGGLLD